MHGVEINVGSVCGVAPLGLDVSQLLISHGDHASLDFFDRIFHWFALDEFKDHVY
jgi:hypothetical protein